MGMIAAFPWNFVIIAALIGLHQTNTPTEGLTEKILFVLYLISLVFGFVNSANITTRNFTLLIVHSVLSVAVASGFMSYLYWGTTVGIDFIYGTGLAVVLINAIISPINSFKSALRDYQIDDDRG
jgi:predicted ABC-type sugar transport system permease subunit